MESVRKIRLALTVAVDRDRGSKGLVHAVVSNIVLQSKLHLQARRRHIFIEKLPEEIVALEPVARRGVIHNHPSRKPTLIAVAIHLHAQQMLLGLLPREINLTTHLLDICILASSTDSGCGIHYFIRIIACGINILAKG